MAILNLDTSVSAVLTGTQKVPDPTNPTQTITLNFSCDLAGNRVDPSSAIPIYQDLFTGKYFAKPYEKLPASADPSKYIHFCSADGKVHGFFVPAPDFNNRDAPTPPPPAVLPAATGTGAAPVIAP